MLQISFQEDSEALKLLQLISVHRLGAEFEPYIEWYPQIGLLVNMSEVENEKWLTLLSEVFHSFLLEEKMLPVLKQIIVSKFFYREQEEIDAIIEIALSIIEGESFEGGDVPFSEEKRFIKEGLRSIVLGKVSFSFDSFTTFRLRSFRHALEKYAALAIDEYKLEQDYQNFIAMLRDRLQEQEAKLSRLHLVYHDGIQFYDHELSRLDRRKLNSLIDRKLLADSSFFLDTVILAPLLSIAPNSLYIYTDNKEEGLIQTMTRIFEERATVLPLSAFQQAHE